MSDLDRRFKDLDYLDTSVSWPEVTNRRPGPPPPQPRGPNRLLAIALAFAVGAGGISLAVRALVVTPAPRVTSSTSPPPTTPPAPPSTRVGATGLVVAYSPSDVRFCVPQMTLALTPGPPPCGPYVKALGVDLSRLSNRKTVHGVTFGDAYLAGALEEGTLHVSQQTPPRPATGGPSLRQPPCQAPPGGWAHSDAPPSLDPVYTYERTYPADVTSLALFHPAAHTRVVTIASTRPDRTTTILGPTFPDQLCVVRSRYQVSDVTAARGTLTSFAQHHQYGVYGAGLGAGRDGQPKVIVSALVETPALDAAISSLPGGLVLIEPWLEPLPR